jgi:hypothetical protein
MQVFPQIPVKTLKGIAKKYQQFARNYHHGVMEN